MHSNFDLNAFPGSFFDVNIGSRKDFCSYRLYRGEKSGQRFHIGAPKSDTGFFFEKVDFGAPEASISVFQIYFSHLSIF